MPDSGGVLVDSSVWIKFFRLAHAREAEHMDFLLQNKAVNICAPVRTEVLSGAKTTEERRRLRELLSAIPLSDPPADIWDRTEESRFQLARKGRQVSVMDLWIACTAVFHGLPLWTLDDDFTVMRTVLPLNLYSF